MVKGLTVTMDDVAHLLLLFGVILALVGGALRLRLRRPPSQTELVLPAPVDERGGLVGPAVATLLVNGLALLLLAQAVFTAGVPVPAAPLAMLSAAGLLLFAGAGRVALRGQASWLARGPLADLSAYLRIRPVQLLLLALAPAYAWLARLAAGDGLQALVPAVAVSAWLAALCSATVGAYRREGAAVKAERWELLLSALLFLLALLVRALYLDRLPPTLAGDEASAGLTAVRFREGSATNLFGLGWFSFPAFYYAVQSSGLWFLGQTTAALRLTSAVAGALTVVVVYWLGRALFDRLTALLAAGYLLVAHFHIHFSRIGLQNIWDGLFIGLVTWGLWAGWRHGRRAPFIVAGMALGLGHYFYVSMRIVPLLLLLWVVAAAWRAPARFRQRLPDLLLAGWIALVVILPLALLFGAHPDEFRAPLQRVSVFGDGWMEAQVARSEDSAPLVILKQVRDSALGFTHLPLRHWYNPGVPLLLAIPAALFLAGLFWAVAACDLGMLLLLLPPLAVVLLGGFSQDAPASQRYVLALPSVALFIALPLGKSAEWLSRYWPRGRRAFAGLALAVLLVGAANDLHFYFFRVYDYYVLGGYNTETATAVAHYLRAQKPAAQKVFFFGPPRMSYASHATIPYLAPAMEGQDVPEPLASPPVWGLEGPTIFVFLPERMEELPLVEAAYPGGRTVAGERSVVDRRSLFVAYEIRP